MNYKKLIAFISLLILPYTIFATVNDSKAVVYQCPEINVITYNRNHTGHFHASTKYDGVEISWTEMHPFMASDLSVNKFIRVQIQPLPGGMGSVQCVYMANNGKLFTLFPELYSQSRTVYYTYETNGTIGTSWNHNMCQANGPRTCQFYILPILHRPYGGK